MTFAEMNLNDAERKLVVAAQIGEVCNLQSKVEGENDPADGDAWGPERTIDADVIRRLCVGAYPGVTVDYRGVRLVGARITGSLRLAHGVINVPVLLDACHFDSPILMTGAEARTVSLAGSHFPALMAGGVVLSGALLMSGAVVGGWSVPKSGVMALQLDGARISSLVRLDEGFSATGMVSMLGTRIRYQLSCRKGRFSNDGAKVRAINADGLDVGGEVFLDDGFVANGGVWLRGARIGRQLSCSGGEFNATHDDALNFDGAVVGGDVFLTEGLTVHGEVSLKASTVGGNLACAGSKLLKPSGTALSMDGATVKGDITLNGEFRAEGDVRLNGIRLGGQLVCDRGSFVSGEGHALIAQGAVIEGDVFMRDCFTAEGEVQFLGASIGGQFGCRKGSFRNAGGSALVGDGLRVAGNVFLDLGFEAEGTVFLPALDVGAQLVCNGGTFANEGGMMMVLQGARVGDIFSWKEIGGGSRGHLNLEDARVNVLVDDVASWPKGEDRLILDGFEYGRLAGDAPLEAEKRLEWLERQKQDVVGFKPQPYEQLADVYDRMGHEEHARKVRIANRRAQREYGDLSRGRWLLNWFWDWTIRYGWRTWRAARFGLGLVVFGFFLFWAAGALGGMRATDRDVWNWLQALVYSLDAFLPIVELGPERKFEPNVMAGASGWIAQIYLWVHILAGWIVTTVIGLGITPLVRQK